LSQETGETREKRETDNRIAYKKLKNKREKSTGEKR
jgi:hypothetical protein